jgi:hypothetical protein
MVRNTYCLALRTRCPGAWKMPQRSAASRDPPGAIETYPFRPPSDLDIFVTMPAKGDAGRASVVSCGEAERGRSGQLSLARLCRLAVVRESPALR